MSAVLTPPAPVTEAGPRPWPVPRQVPASPIRAALPAGAIDLGLGAPTWGTEVLEASGSGLSDFQSPGHLGYPPHAGLPELRRAVADFEGVDPEQVQITCGAQGALSSLARVFLGPGRLALVPDPGFPAYAALARLVGAEVRTYALGPDLRLDVDAVARALDAVSVPASASGSPLGTVIFVNAPSNPVGAGASVDALASVAELCRRRGVLLVSDEVYRPLSADGTCPGLRSSHSLATSPSAVGLSIDDGAVVLGSLSKGWALPGLRVGWMVADPEILEPCRRAHAWAMTSAAGPTQALAAELVRQWERLLLLSRAQLDERWQRAEEVWQEELGLSLPRPDGGFYLWLPSNAHPDEVRHRLAEEHGVGVVAGSAFGPAGESRLRVSVAAEPDVVAEGLRRLLRGLLALDPSWPDLLTAHSTTEPEP